MTNPCADCSENLDSRKLVREGANQVQRVATAPDPEKAPVDERRPEHAMVFAASYASYLRYFDATDTASGDWREFFAQDVSALLAVAAVEDVGAYRSTVKSLLRSIEDPEPPPSGPAMVAALRAVFDVVGSLARGLDALTQGLPNSDPLRNTLSNLIQTQLSPMFRRLIGYYEAGRAMGVLTPGPPPTGVRILGRPAESFSVLVNSPLSIDWPKGVGLDTWTAYRTVVPAEYQGAYGQAATVVEQVNHLGTHNLFTAICETFLRVFARVATDARAAVQSTFEWDGHEPHYALFLAFLRLLEHARAEANTITAEHLDFYYRRVLRLNERAAVPSHAHVLVELAKHAEPVLVAEGTLLKAGKDDEGVDARFAVDRDLVANKGKVVALKSVYRHPHSPAEGLAADADRIFASPIANSDDGMGAKLTTPDGSWHPFANKTYVDGALTAIDMPTADVGFAVASHYLWLAEGTRTITLDFMRKARGKTATLDVDLDVLLTTEKGWLQKKPDSFVVAQHALTLTITLDGNDPPVTPYVPKVHGVGFDTPLPLLIVKLRHARNVGVRDFTFLEKQTIKSVTLGVAVSGLKTLALSNDLGPIDSSKPFQAYGPAPTEGGSLVVGSKEVFQKKPTQVTINMPWMTRPVAHKKAATDPSPSVMASYLDQGKWHNVPGFKAAPVDTVTYVITLTEKQSPDVDPPDLTASEQFSTSSRHGFMRLSLTRGFELQDYAVKLAGWIKAGATPPPPTAPVVPTIASLIVDYTAHQTIDLGKAAANTSASRGRFFHVGPFGHAELLAPGPLMPQFTHEGELFVGVTGLAPPQNLALLFQVVDGTANPLAVKPDDHIEWSYLRGNQWVHFAGDAVDDGTDGLLASGIVTLAVPADASIADTLMPSGMNWIRLAVGSASDAVCRLVSVAAQALRATYVIDHPSATAAQALPAGTITKLDQPDADVKAIAQPFPSFGGRPRESTLQFVTRVSERLRHKDRGIALWDYEHLILDAFPSIYQARCLNHTQYEPSATGGTYRELAPGNVTVVTIPDLQMPNPRDPLRPYTSLRVLGEIERFLAGRVSCFTRLHVRNPQFEEVRVSLRVRFRDGADETFHVNRLKREITEFLSPWAFRSDVRPTFNGKVYRSVVIDFVEERPYVDFVTDVKLFHEGTVSPEEVVGSRAVSILVSVPAAEHEVIPIHDDDDIVAEHCACAPRIV